MLDIYDFEKVTVSKAEYISLNAEIWIWFLKWDNLSSGGMSNGNIYTIPTGYKAVISDVTASGNFTGRIEYYIPGGDNIWLSYWDQYNYAHHSFVLPPVANAGETVVATIWNEDIISGNFRGMLSMWLVPGSVPEKPQNNSSEEKFRVGEYNIANHILLENGDVIILFHDRKEKEENYLHFKNYGEPNQVKIFEKKITFAVAKDLLGEDIIKRKKVISEIEKK